MELYYDTLVPYFPDSIKVEENGEIILKEDPQQIARRDAMIALAKFQRTGAPTQLSLAILNACIFSKVDLIDMTLSLEQIVVSDSDDPEQLVNRAAKMLLQSLKSDYKFDLYEFAACLYLAEHKILTQISESDEVAHVE